MQRPVEALGLGFADLDVDAAVVLADLALEAGNVDLHHRLARALIIEVGEHGERHNRSADEHTDQQPIIPAIHTVRHIPSSHFLA